MFRVPEKILSARQLCDAELLLTGGFAPLDGYLTRDDYAAVLESMRLSDGRLWPMPISLLLSDEERAEIGSPDILLLRDAQGRPVAEVEIEAMDPFDRNAYGAAMLGHADDAHPYLRRLAEDRLRWRVGGRIVLREGVRRNRFAHLRRDPAETRAMLKAAGWGAVVAFQTRNPLHRSHFHLTEFALEEAGAEAGLLLHPAVGPTQPGDIDAGLRVACYERILHRYEPGRAALSLLPLAMRMMGPREGLWHAMIRRNHGATHFIMGRDHAGPSAKRTAGGDFFEPYAAQALFARHMDEIGITPIFSKAIAYYPDLERYLPVDQAPANARALALSGTRQREILAAGEVLPDWYSFPEVAELLSAGARRIAA